MPDLLTMRIVPEGERITFAALEQAVIDMRRLIRHIDRAVTRDISKRARKWYVERLVSSDPTILLVPETIPGETVSTPDVIVDGVRFITEREPEGPPAYFSEQELEDLLKLKQSFERGIRRVSVSSNEREEASITPTTTERVQRILRETIQSLGSLEGVLDAIDVHSNPRFTIWERLSGNAVRCYFAPHERDVIKGLLGQRVRVSGLISYFADGRPRTVRQLSAVSEIHPAPSRSYWASVRDFTNGRDSVEYLRAAGDD